MEGMNENSVDDKNTHAVEMTPSTPTKSKKSKIEKPINWSMEIKRKIFILSWIRNYDCDMMVGDVIAGITLGLTMIPQSIAYAALAGLPSQYGLYSAFLGTIIYAFFGTVKEISMGPTAILSLVTLQYTIDKPVEYTIVLSFIAGCVILSMGIFNLGILADFISVPITNAFSSATLLLVVGSQLKTILNITYSSKGFADSLYHLVLRLTETRIWDTVLGVACCALLILFRVTFQPQGDYPVKSNHPFGKFLAYASKNSFAHKYVNVKSASHAGKIVKKTLWYLSQASSMLIIILTSIVAFQWVAGTAPFKLLGSVPEGIPSFTLPPFQFDYQNRTMGFVDICKDLGSGIIVAPIIAVSANIAIAKTFSSAATLDATQEMLTLGLCQLTFLPCSHPES